MTPWSIILDLATITWRMLVPALIGAALGYGLDQFFQTTAIFFLALSTLGLIIGGKSALALTNTMPKERNTFDDDTRRRRSPRKFDC